MKFEKLIRVSPKICVLGAALDFVKQALWVLPYWLERQEAARLGDVSALAPEFKLELARRLFELILYPFGWIATAIVITLLLAVYDNRTSLPSEPA